MKRTLLTLTIALAASVASAQYVDDFYGPPAAKKTKVQKIENAVTESSSIQNGAYNEYAQQYEASPAGTPQELITSYEAALQRRISALRSSGEQSESYWQLLEQYQAVLEKKYNQNLYNIVVVGSDMWVEPQSITALFDGTDPAAGVIKYNSDIRKQLKDEQRSATVTQNSSQVESAASNVVIQLTVIDPWDSWWSYPYYSYWGSPWGRPYYWGSPYWGGYWDSPYWGGYWGGYWNRPYWGGYYSGYYGNPHGTYYGNSRNNRPVYGNSNGMGGGRGNGTMRANGNNTVYNGTRGTRTEGYARQSSVNRPANFGGVSTSRPTRSEGSSQRPTTSRPGVERPTTYTRPTTTRTERSTTYERPATRSTTYDRPSSSGSGRSGGGSIGGGSMGGGRRR